MPGPSGPGGTSSSGGVAGNSAAQNSTSAPVTESAGASSSAGTPGNPGASGPGASSPGASGSAGTSAPGVSGSADASSSGGALPGLSAACSAVIQEQVAINELFGKSIGVGPSAAPTATGSSPVTSARPLTAADVSAVFGNISAEMPAEVKPALQTLHDAATRAIGKSDVDVAAILAETKVADAMAALSNYIKRCSPATS